MALGSGFVQQFDDLINNLILGPLDRGLSSLSSGIAGAFSGGGRESAGHESAGGGLLSSIAGIFSRNDGPSISAPERTPSMTIEAPVQQHAQFHFAPEDLGQLAPPTFGGKVASIGAGMTMNG